MQTSEALKTTEEPRGKKIHAALRARLGDDIYTSWFKTLDFDSFDGKTVVASVPVKFLRNWIQSHYIDDLLACSQVEFEGAQSVEVQLRQPGGMNQRTQVGPNLEALRPNDNLVELRSTKSVSEQLPRASSSRSSSIDFSIRPPAGGVDGSPLYPHHTFENFVVGAPNRLAHAAAVQAAETVMNGSSGINPLFLHSSVGLGKTHLLQAIAWEVRRRSTNANVLYLTAERFRYEFVEALRSSDPLAFKDRFRHI
ncbi:MAG: DnaA ATPase domain-containing protein, partial [Hyphomicrobium sp.]